MCSVARKSCAALATHFFPLTRQDGSAIAIRDPQSGASTWLNVAAYGEKWIATVPDAL